MELQHLNIDNYINWYKELSRKVDFAIDNEWKIKRYLLTGWDLQARYIRNKANIKSKELSEKIMAESKILSERVKEVKEYMQGGIVYDLWFVPPFAEWIYYDQVINDFTNAPIEFITEKLKSAALPPIKILIEELERINQKEWDFSNNVMNGNPMVKAKVKDMEGSWGIGFAQFTSDCYYAKWLHNRIKELENQPTESVTRLQWNGTGKDFSELIKALSLTALKGVQETEIIKILGSVFELKGKPFKADRHRININDLQDTKPSDLFTAKMNKEINNYLKSLIETER